MEGNPTKIRHLVGPGPVSAEVDLREPCCSMTLRLCVKMKEIKLQGKKSTYIPHHGPRMSSFLLLPIDGKRLLGKTKSNKSRRNTVEGSALEAAVPARCRSLRKCPSMSHAQHRFSDVVTVENTGPPTCPHNQTDYTPQTTASFVFPQAHHLNQKTSNLKLRASAVLSPAISFSS